MSLKDRTRGTDVKETVIAALVKVNLLIPKLSAIATEWAPAMNEFVNGLVGLCKADQTFPELGFPLYQPHEAARV